MKIEKLKATHQGVIKINGKDIKCAVLNDGTRVLTSESLFETFEKSKKGTKNLKSQVTKLPYFLQSNTLKPYLNKEFFQVTQPIIYINKRGKQVTGFKAQILPKVCSVLLKARRGNALRKNQLDLAEKAELIQEAYSELGIIAHIDEATGKREELKKNDYQKLINMFLAPEFRNDKRFPRELFERVCQLRGWKYDPDKTNYTPEMGNIINKYIYNVMPKEVMTIIRSLNPGEYGSRKHKFHQGLSKDFAVKILDNQINRVLTLLKASETWNGFEKLYNKLAVGQRTLLDAESL